MPDFTMRCSVNSVRKFDTFEFETHKSLIVVSAPGNTSIHQEKQVSTLFFQPAVSWTSEYQFYNLHSFVAEWSSCFMADIGSKNPQIKTIGNEVSKRTWRYSMVSPLNWKISKLWPDLSWASFGAKRREIEDEKFNTGNSVVNGKYVSRRCNNHGLSHPFAVLHNTEEQSNCSS